jgi:hypothetical protein
VGAQNGAGLHQAPQHLLAVADNVYRVKVVWDQGLAAADNIHRVAVVLVQGIAVADNVHRVQDVWGQGPARPEGHP